MKLIDLYATLFLLATIILGGWAYCEWKKASTGSSDIRKPSLEKALTGRDSVQKRVCATFECMAKRTE